MTSNNRNKPPHEIKLMMDSVFEEIRKEYFQHFNIDMFDTNNKIKKQDVDKQIAYWQNEQEKIQNLLKPNDVDTILKIKVDTRLMFKKTLIDKFYFALLQDTGKLPNF